MAAGTSLATSRDLRCAPCVRDLGRDAMVVTRAAPEGAAARRPAGRRGPKPALSDEDVLAAIRRTGAGKTAAGRDVDPRAGAGAVGGRGCF